MTDHDYIPPLHPILQMRFGSELNPPEPADTPSLKIKFETKPAAKANAHPGDAPETSS